MSVTFNERVLASAFASPFAFHDSHTLVFVLLLSLSVPTVVMILGPPDANYFKHGITWAGTIVDDC